MRLKVGIVVPGGVDPAGRHTLPWLAWLLERLARDYDVHVFALLPEPQPREYSFLGARVHNVGGGRLCVSRGVAALCAEHRRGPFHVLHAFWAVSPGLVAALAKPLVRCPILLHVAGGEIASIPDIGYGAARSLRGRLTTRVAFRAATVVSAASRPVIEALTARRIASTFLPLGVDTRSWPRRAPRPRPPGRELRLVHVASLNRVKDQNTLMAAMARLGAQGLGFRLDVAGDDALNGETARLVQSLGLADRIVFHGFVARERLRELVESADMLVLSSRHETGPVAALEAAVAGIPTVGTAVGHIRDLAPTAAVAVPLGDADGLADAIVRLDADDAERQALARAAQQWATQHDADWTASRISEIYSAFAACTA